jgi:hypothetical protein
MDNCLKKRYKTASANAEAVFAVRWHQILNGDKVPCFEQQKSPHAVLPLRTLWTGASGFGEYSRAPSATPVNYIERSDSYLLSYMPRASFNPFCRICEKFSPARWAADYKI